MCELVCQSISYVVWSVAVQYALGLPLIIALKFIVTVSPTEHVVVHVYRTTVLDGITELLGKDLL